MHHGTRENVSGMLLREGYQWAGVGGTSYYSESDLLSSEQGGTGN